MQEHEKPFDLGVKEGQGNVSTPVISSAWLWEENMNN